MSLARSEAMSIWFSSHYRFAVKIGTGRINALSDEPWSSGLRQQLTDYVVAPGPPWSENDEVLRRYVALPLRTDLSTDGHSDRMANVSGIVLKVAPMLAESYYRDEGAFFLRDIKEFFMRLIFAPRICAKVAESHLRGEEWERRHPEEEETESIQEVTAHQEVLEDPYALWEWDQAEAISCCIHPCDESLWRRVTGTNPWHPPLTAEDYRGAGIPWLDNYRDAEELLDHDWSVTLTHSVPRSETSRRVQIRELPDPPHNAVKP